MVSVLDQEIYFRPVLKPQGESVGAIVSVGSQVQQSGDVLSECGGTVSVVTQKLKPVAQFQFVDDEGLSHIISSNADAADRYDKQVLAAVSSLEFIRRDPAVFDRLPAHVAAAIAVGLQVDLWNPLCVGSLIAIPVRPLPHDPVDALVALATLPLVGARVRSVSALGVLELCIERWPRSCAVFDGGGEKVFRCGRLISAPLPALPETLVVVSVLDPESYFRPVLEPQGKSIGASVSFGSQVQQPGDVVSECSGTVCAVTQKLKPVAQFQFIDDDGMAHIISSNADAAGRYDKVRGLLRVWSPALIFKFVRDLEIDFSAMCREIGFAGLPTFAGMEGGFFPLVRRVRHSPCLSSPGQVERVVCAQWCLTDPARLRLSDLAAEPVVWPAPSAPALQEAGRVTLRATLINIGRVLAAVWHTAFLGAFQIWKSISANCVAISGLLGCPRSRAWKMLIYESRCVVALIRGGGH